MVIGALGTDTKGLIKGLEDLEIRGHVETLQWDWSEYLRLEETRCHSDSSEKPFGNACLKNFHQWKTMKIIKSFIQPNGRE